MRGKSNEKQAEQKEIFVKNCNSTATSTALSQSTSLYKMSNTKWGKSKTVSEQDSLTINEIKESST